MRSTILKFTVTFLLLTLSAHAHPMGNFSINHHSRIRVEGDSISVRYILDFAEIPTYQMFPQGTDGIAPLAQQWTNGLQLEIDGVKASLATVHIHAGTTPGAGGLPTLKVMMDLATPWTGPAATIHFSDINFPDRIGWKEIVVQSDGAADFPDGNPFATDRSNDLTLYPADLLSSAPNIVDASLRIVHRKGTTSQAQAPGAPGTASTAAARTNDRLSSILTARDIPVRLMILGLAVAFALGAMHALSPGHGKTVVAAYLVGNRGTARHAVFLGGVVTLTHTVGVFALGIVTLFLSHYVVPERLYPVLSFVSGGMIVAIGINLFRQRFSALTHDHSHEIPQGLTFRSLLALGFSGGIVPCPSALVVLLSAVALNRIRIGLLFILAFSLGLACVLVAIGILVVRAGRWLSRFDTAHSATRFLPVLSAIVVTIIGVGISIQSLSSTQIWNGGFAWSSGAIAVLGLGLVLGLKHATDADHVVAVTTFVSDERSLLRSCWIGAFWGAGHTLSLALAGLIVIGLKINISEWLSDRLELLVAVMLVGLGARVLVQTLRGRIEAHTHDHAHPDSRREKAHSHWHLHTHVGESAHSGWSHFGLRPLLVGMVHGAAGSAALMLLVLSTIRSPLQAFLYILIFGFGSVVGMLVISLLLALPLHWAKSRVAVSYKPIQLVAGLFSCGFGLYLGAHLWMLLP